VGDVVISLVFLFAYLLREAQDALGRNNLEGVIENMSYDFE